MHHLSILSAYQETSAGRHSRELVHEVKEEDFFEGIATQLGKGIDLGHKVLILEFVLGVPLDTIVEALGDGEEIQVFHEAGDWFMEVDNEWSPANLGRVIEGDLVG